jgi:sugar phosphate isomerase/epimerase
MPSPAINPVYLTGSLRNWPLHELAAMGYKGLEISPACLESLSTWKPVADAAELKPICVNALPELTPYLTGSLHDGVEHRRRATLDALLRALEIMNRKEISFLLIAPGRLAENYQNTEQAWELLVSSIEELSRAAGEVTILAQSVPHRLFNRTTDLAKLIDEIGSPRFAAAIDIGHLILCQASPADAVAELGDRLRYIQVHDVDIRPGLPRLDRHLPMGQGSLDREDIIPVLRALPIAVNCASPSNPLAAAKEALAWITGEVPSKPSKSVIRR